MIWVWMPRQNPIPFDANPTLHLSHSKSFGPARSLPFAVGYCWYCVGVLEYYYIGYFLLFFFSAFFHRNKTAEQLRNNKTRAPRTCSLGELEDDPEEAPRTGKVTGLLVGVLPSLNLTARTSNVGPRKPSKRAAGTLDPPVEFHRRGSPPPSDIQLLHLATSS